MKDIALATANIAIGAAMVTAMFQAPSTILPLVVALALINL